MQCRYSQKLPNFWLKIKHFRHLKQSWSLQNWSNWGSDEWPKRHRMGVLTAGHTLMPFQVSATLQPHPRCPFLGHSQGNTQSTAGDITSLISQTGQSVVIFPYYPQNLILSFKYSSFKSHSKMDERKYSEYVLSKGTIGSEVQN